MKRLFAIASLLSAAGVPGMSLAADCEWKEPAGKPTLKADDGATRFTYKLDPTWFRCAKKAGGTATLQFLVGQEGKLAVHRELPITSYSIYEGDRHEEVCKQRPLPERVQVRLVGTGPMEKLSFTSEVLPVHCQRCQFAGDDNSLALNMKNTAVPQGMAVLEGNVDKEWWACAKEGSTLEARFYFGKTYQEVSKAAQNTFVLKGLEADWRFKKAFPERQLCEAAFVGVELFGTGEMAALNGRGRSVDETKCK